MGDTEKQTLIMAGQKHAQSSSLKENSFFKIEKESLLIYSLTINGN